MPGFISNLFKRKCANGSNRSAGTDSHLHSLDGPRGRTFMRWYICIRGLIIFLGTIPGIFLWPLFLVAGYFWAPQFLSFLGIGAEWIVANVFFMFGDYRNYPAISFHLYLLFPTVIAFLIVILENLSGFFLVVERHQGLQQSSEYE